MKKSIEDIYNERELYEFDKISREASLYGFTTEMIPSSYIFESDNIQITIQREWDFDANMNRVIKTLSEGSEYKNANHILNEALGAGYSDMGFFGGMGGDPYCEYKVIPLNHDLEMKTSRQEEAINRNFKNRIIHIADYVSGLSKGKRTPCEGVIQRFSRNSDNDIITVYILNRSTGKIVPLDPETVKLASPYSTKRKPMKMINSGNIIGNGQSNMIGGVSN